MQGSDLVFIVMPIATPITLANRGSAAVHEIGTLQTQTRASRADEASQTANRYMEEFLHVAAL